MIHNFHKPPLDTSARRQHKNVVRRRSVRRTHALTTRTTRTPSANIHVLFRRDSLTAPCGQNTIHPLHYSGVRDRQPHNDTHTLEACRKHKRIQLPRLHPIISVTNPNSRLPRHPHDHLFLFDNNKHKFSQHCPPDRPPLRAFIR